MSAPKESPSLSAVPRLIPGFTQQPSTTAPKPRKRSSKKGGAAATLGPQTTGTVEPVSEEKGEGVVTEDLADESLIKKTNAVEQTKKRLRAQNKKLQRLDAYEAKADINEDQRRALAGRGTIDAVVKELNELLVILQAEEAEDVEREKRVIAAEEKKHARAVEAAVQAQKAEAQSQLVFLFQFLRLRSLFVPDQPSSFAPPVLPPAIAAARGQEVAAVHTLFDEFSNGPLLGGNGDALEKLEKIASGSQDQIIEGVTFARISELVHGLTAPPPSADQTPLDSPIIESSSAPGPSDSVVALVDGEKEAHPAPSFLNESEIEPPSPPADKVASWQDEVADNTQVAPSDPATPKADILSFTGQTTPSNELPSPIVQALGGGNASETLSAVTPPVESVEEPKLDWSTEEAGGALPDLPELAPPVRISNEQQAEVQGDGFQKPRGPRRGGYRGGGPGPDGQRRGSFRGRGRGEGRGRGARGGRGRGGPAPAPAA
ncbi:uncharacterized protein JCM6883_004691 [Sporobolomyces salmoneus]|uniref:uncharacterized protein n=1 Tax=Sporobolomyces salmoneus TaxID=183962 RepID=UPI00317195E5